MAAFTEYTEPVWRGLDMRKLKVDEAYLVTKNFYNKPTYLYSLSDECYTCPYTKVKVLNEHNNDNITSASSNINVAHGLKFKLLANDVGRYAFNNNTSLCHIEPTNLKEFGVYNLTLHKNGSCSWDVDNEGVNVNLSFLSIFLLVTLILNVLKISLCAWRSWRYDEVLANATANESPMTPPPVIQQRNRMRSLDTFRGMAIVLMIFVNSGGGNYWWIEHAPWNGLHVADIVFPSFLWIMGVCIPISVKSQLARGNTKLRICLRIIWRSVKLFTIGLCLNSINGPNLENLRIMGVLQRFGIAYLICGVVHTIFTEKEYIEPQVSWKRELNDLILFKGEICLVLILIIVNLSIIFGLDVPNCPKGYLGPGGKHNNASYPQCIGGATGYIDLQLLGESHIYQHPTAKYIYDSKPFDPEGIFGCLLTVVQVFFGVLAGVIILVHTDWKARITRWLLWSMFLTTITAILSGFSKESGIIPINKNLWSLSYVCVTTALAFTLLSLLYYIIDVRHWWTGYPFEECGMNAIIMYVGHTIMHKMLPWHWRIGSMNTHFVLLLESIWNTWLWIAIALYLDHIKFYYSV